MDFVFEHGRFDGQSRRGWTLGHFMEGPRRSSEVEVKWGAHGREESSPGWSHCETATTLSVLVSGRFELAFRNVPENTVMLNAPGDYVLFGPGVSHRWTAVEDAVIMTVRWPSLPGDCSRSADQ